MGNLPSLSHTRNTYKALKALGKTPTPANTRKTVNVVYGSPCAGKTTYVREHAGDDDIIVDADALYAAISNRDPHDMNFAQYNIASNELREAMYDVIRYRKGRWKTAWVIAVCPTQNDRDKVKERVLADNFILIDTDEKTCVERGKERGEGWDTIIRNWFRRYYGDHS